MHDWLIGVWYGSARGGWILAPLGWLFGIAAALRRALYHAGVLRARRPPCPVVVIGNVTVGGTGKTPLAIWLARRLGQEGVRVGIASRGYRRSAHGEVRLVDRSDDAAEVGDEPLLLARRTRAQVAVGRSRAEVAERLAQEGADVVICDDGLQHYALARDVEVAVVDGGRRFGNGRLLPAGPLREPASRLDRVPWVFCNGGHPGEGEISMRVVGQRLRRVGDGAAMDLRELDGRACHAVAAIGNPERFFETLREAGARAVPHVLPDHASVDSVVDRLPGDEVVIMTEKDAVKYRGSRRGDTWYLPVDARPGPGADGLVAEILRLIYKGADGPRADSGKS